MRMPRSLSPVAHSLGAGLVLLASACSSSSSDTTSGGGDAGSGPSTSAQTCARNADCASKVCNAGAHTCVAASPTDGAQNADETDIDCGGAIAKKCADLAKCKVGADCAAGVCADTGTGLTCQAPSTTDGVKNGTETGTDCGGPGNPTCANGQGCTTRDDCTAKVCTGAVCVAPTPADGMKNGTETDVDCGGPAAPPCGDLKACLAAGDCNSAVCTGSICQVPTTSDKVKNGVETDIDCGGAGNPKCTMTTNTCLAATDCTSGGCDYTKHCALKRSCVAQNGGDTCGFGGDGSVGAKAWESCCATAPVTVGTTAVQLGKYQVTAGRMRAFLTAVNGNVRDFVRGVRTSAPTKIPFYPGSTTHTVLDDVWDVYLPTSFAGDPTEPPDCDQGGWDGSKCKPGSTYAPLYTSANLQVGGTIFKANSQPNLQGCDYGSPGTHMYYLGAAEPANQTADYSQAVYDQKPMQCMTQILAQAFCIWDGGRLETLEEWKAAWGPAAFPYGASPTPKNQGFDTYYACRFPSATDALLRTNGDCPAALIPDASHSIEYATYGGSYEWPLQKNDGNDFSVYVSAPGRTRARGPGGHADVVGNLLEVTSSIATWNASPFSVISPWAANGSWEGHGYSARNAFGSYGIMDKYGKQGFRCAYP